MEGPWYHTFTPCDSQVPLTVGFSCTIICVPGGTRGLALQLNSPCSWAYPDNFGFMCNFRSKLSMRLTCGRTQHHKCSGKSLWVLDNLEMKCSLKFRMARSAEFLRWMWGGTNWNSNLLVFKSLLVKRLWSLWYAVFNSNPFAFSKVPHEWCLNHNGRLPIYIYWVFWMWLETVLFSWCKFSLSNPLYWRRQYWCLLTARMGEIDPVLFLGLVLVLIGVPFSAWIVGLSEVVEDARGWLLVFYLSILAQGQVITPAKKWRGFYNCLYPPGLSGSPAWYVVVIHKCAFWFALMTCSSPRRTFFLHALSFECTSKTCITFLNQFSVYFLI